MKLGLISDIHGNLHALEQVLLELEERQVQLILCAGDLVCYGAFPNEVLELLRQKSIPTVLGNYDAAVAWDLPTVSSKPSSPQTEPIKLAALAWAKAQISNENVHYLRGLPWVTWHRLGDTTVQLLHGGPTQLDAWYDATSNSKLCELAETTAADLLVIGHSHQQFAIEVVRSIGEKTLIVNPGAVGRSIDGDPRAAYAVIDLTTRQVELLRAEYDLDAATEAIRKSSMPSLVADLVYHAARRVENLGTQKI